MNTLFKNNRGATVVEFGLVALPVFWFILGIIQIGWVVWIDNLLYSSVNTAARCAAVQSTTSPCSGTDAVSAANQVFFIGGATFTTNGSCSLPLSAGLVGTYNVNFLMFNLTLTAASCYPSLS